MKSHPHPTTLPTQPGFAHDARVLRMRWRRLQSTDVDSLQAFFRAQSAADRRLRFHSAVKEVSRSWLDHLLMPGDQPYVAFVATLGEAEGAPLVAEAVMALDADGAGAEIGLMVDAGWRGHGVGAWCLKQIEREGLARQVRYLRANVLPGNEAMSALLRRCGYEPGISARDDLPGQLVLRLATATERSVLNRCMECLGLSRLLRRALDMDQQLALLPHR